MEKWISLDGSVPTGRRQNVCWKHFQMGHSIWYASCSGCVNKRYIFTYKASVFKEASIKVQEPCCIAVIFSQELITFFDGKALSLKQVFWRDKFEKHISLHGELYSLHLETKQVHSFFFSLNVIWIARKA